MKVPCCFGRAVGSGCTCRRAPRQKRLPEIKVGDRLYFTTMGTVVSVSPKLCVEYDHADGEVGRPDILGVDRGEETIYDAKRDTP